MPTHATLSATPAAPRTLAESSLAQSAGTYPGATTYPASDDYPGRGSDITASAIASTTDFIPAIVPFIIQTGTRLIVATPIT